MNGVIINELNHEIFGKFYSFFDEMEAFELPTLPMQNLLTSKYFLKVIFILYYIVLYYKVCLLLNCCCGGLVLALGMMLYDLY